jgi:hypothetical protein
MKRLREEAGVTLTELVMAMTIGLVVLTGVFAMLDTTVKLNTGVMSKTDAMQRGRLAMDIITQELRSQVCLNTFTDPAVVGPATTGDSVTFYSDFSNADGDTPIQKRKLSFDPATGNITTTIYRTTKLRPVANDLITPTTKQLRLENASLQTVRGADGKPVAPIKYIPFLTYYAYDVSSGRALATEKLVPGANGLTAAQAARVARIDVNFVARPTGADTDDKGVNLTDQIMVRHADPNLTVPDPKCI